VELLVLRMHVLPALLCLGEGLARPPSSLTAAAAAAGDTQLPPGEQLRVRSLSVMLQLR
jgi:hypothetical protein